MKEITIESRVLYINKPAQRIPLAPLYPCWREEYSGLIKVVVVRPKRIFGNIDEYAIPDTLLRNGLVSDQYTVFRNIGGNMPHKTGVYENLCLLSEDSEIQSPLKKIDKDSQNTRPPVGWFPYENPRICLHSFRHQEKATRIRWGTATRDVAPTFNFRILGVGAKVRSESDKPHRTDHQPHSNWVNLLKAARCPKCTRRTAAAAELFVPETYSIRSNLASTI
jgi:hypothetical protein